MKPFDIELAKEGQTVQTRDGRQVEIARFDNPQYPNTDYPIIGLIERKNADGYPDWFSESWTAEGYYESDGDKTGDREMFHLDDLVMEPRKIEVWANFYPQGIIHWYATKELATRSVQLNCLGTRQIHWEE